MDSEWIDYTTTDYDGDLDVQYFWDDVAKPGMEVQITKHSEGVVIHLIGSINTNSGRCSCCGIYDIKAIRYRQLIEWSAE